MGAAKELGLLAHLAAEICLLKIHKPSSQEAHTTPGFGSCRSLRLSCFLSTSSPALTRNPQMFFFGNLQLLTPLCSPPGLFVPPHRVCCSVCFSREPPSQRFPRLPQSHSSQWPKISRGAVHPTPKRTPPPPNKVNLKQTPHCKSQHPPLI